MLRFLSSRLLVRESLLSTSFPLQVENFLVLSGCVESRKEPSLLLLLLLLREAVSNDAAVSSSRAA